VFYYILALLFIIAGVYLVCAGGLLYYQTQSTEAKEAIDYGNLWNPWLLLFTTIGVSTLIGAGTTYKILSLSDGGKSVARMMGGTPVPADTKDMAERRLLNVVEEMAIASGVPVPPVYIIEEKGINAFAAGFNPSDAIIGVTRGCVDELNRDELQGVIAHEFSHILYGDIRLNIRLIGILFGILLIAVTGRLVLQGAIFSGGGRRGRTSRNRGGRGQLAILIVGLSLMAIGAIGVLFGRLIKSAIARQREFLADASAVQFTRNPDGITNALAKIGNYASRLRSARTEETSHMFFANAVKRSYGSLLATHPPVAERIRRINPNFDLIAVKREKARKRWGETDDKKTATAASSPDKSAILGDNPARLTARIGMLAAASIEYATKMVDSIPKNLRTAARTLSGARAIIYCLLLSRDKEAFSKQKEYLSEHLDGPTRESVIKLAQEVQALPIKMRMPIVDLTLTALQQQNEVEYKQFKQTVEFLISADNNVSIFEFALSRNLMRHLEPVYGKPEKIRASYYGIKRLVPTCLPLLALLARYGNEDNPQQAKADFTEGVKELDVDPETTPMPETGGDPVEIFDTALTELRKANGKVKKQIVNACVAAVIGNRKVTVREAELLRAVCDSLDCPLPPIVPSAGQEQAQ
jgi:Zn-dependent protease with chaperone function